jgi:hypothetical protein
MGAGVLSQNAAFRGIAPPHEYDDWAPGHATIEELREQLVREGWGVSAVEAWRGSGWSLTCSSAGDDLEIYFAGTPPEWVLQIAPTKIPSSRDRSKGKPASATPAACYALARAVHAALLAQQRWSDFHWCWDDDPSSDRTTEVPTEAPLAVQVEARARFEAAHDAVLRPVLGALFVIFRPAIVLFAVLLAVILLLKLLRA